MLGQGRPFTLRPRPLAPSAYIRVHLRLVSVFGPIRGPYSRAFAVFFACFAPFRGYSDLTFLTRPYLRKSAVELSFLGGFASLREISFFRFLCLFASIPGFSLALFLRVFV